MDRPLRNQLKPSRNQAFGPWLLLWFTTVLASVCWAPQAAGQSTKPPAFEAFPLPAVGSNATWEETYQPEDRFPPPPRELARALTRGYEAYAKGEMVEAFGWLERVIRRPTPEDFLLRGPVQPDGSRLVVSMSWAAHCLFCALPDRQRELFQLKHGANAQRMLTEALQTRDSQQLSQVAQQFPYTEAGVEATLLLGYEHFQSQRPGLAAGLFRRLRMIPEARSQHDPGLSVLLAICSVLSDQPDQATVALRGVDLQAGESFELAGQPLKWIGENQKPLEWLEQFTGPFLEGGLALQQQWLMDGGSPHRLTPSGIGLPMATRRWEVPRFNDLLTEKAIGDQQDQQAAHLPVQPVGSPLVVGETVLMRSFRQVMAVDMKSGKRSWYYPSIGEIGTIYPGFSPLTNNQRPEPSEVMQWLQRQAGADDLASDGQRVFFIEPLPGQGDLSGGIWLNGSRSSVSGANRLIALDVERQGSLIWIAGGEDGNGDPRLANAFFLGAPLPMQDSLFSIVWLDNMVQLIQLDAQTGELRWQQALATVDSVVRLDDGSQQSLSPAYANGVLICPTGLGVVVGIDLATRSLLWGVDYPSNINVGRFQTRNAPEQRWMGQAVRIMGRRVLLTPQESDYLFCIDLLSGRNLWLSPNSRPEMEDESNRRRRQVRSGSRATGTASDLKGLPRDQDLLIAAGTEEFVATLGDQMIRVIQAEDGQVVWEKRLPGNSQPTGPGYFNQQFLWLPTADRRIVAWELATGKQLQQTQLPWTAHNLISLQDHVLAVGANSMAAFIQGQSAEKLFAKLDEQSPQPDNQLPVALLRFRAQLYRYQGQWAPAIQAMAQLWERESSPQNETELTGILLDALADGFQLPEPLLAKYGKLLERRDPVAYYRMRAEGLMEREPSAAIEVLFRLIELPPDLKTSRWQLPSDDGSTQLTWAQWGCYQLRTLQADVLPESWTQLLHQHIDRGITEAKYLDLLRFCQVLGTEGWSNQQIMQLATWLVRQKRFGEAQWLLTPLLQLDPPPESARLLARQILQESGWAQTNRLTQASGERPSSDSWIAGRPVWRGWFDSLRRTTVQFDVAALSQGGTWSPVTVRSTDSSWELGLSCRWRTNDNLLEVTDGWGSVRATIVLQELIPRNLNYRLRAHQWDWGAQSLLQFGNELILMDWTQIQSDRETPQRWVRDLASQDWSITPPTELGPVQAFVENDLDSQRYQRQNQDSFGAISNLQQERVLVHTGSKLICFHPLTGELRWSRPHTQSVRTIWQSKEGFHVLSDLGNCRILDLDSGQEIGNSEVPEIMEQCEVVPAGRYLVAKSLSRFHYVGAWDLETHDWAWKNDSVELPASRAKMSVCPAQGEMAVLTTTGQLSILDIATGKARLQRTVAEGPVVEVELQYAADCWLVFRKEQNRKNWERSVDGLQFMPFPETNEMIAGRLFCFERQAGNPENRERWPGGLPIEDYCYVDCGLKNAPFIALASRVSASRQVQRRGEQCHVAILDLRDGSMVLERTVPMQYRLGLSADPHNATLEVAAAAYSATIQWTPDPDRPPHPKAELKLPQSAEMRTVFGIKPGG